MEQIQKTEMDFIESETDVNLDQIPETSQFTYSKNNAEPGERTSEIHFKDKKKKEIDEKDITTSPNNRLCSMCQKEYFGEYVCIPCQSRLCKDCSLSHKSDEHDVIATKEFMNNRFPCLTCQANASHHCCFCNFDFCTMCKDYHQNNGLMKHEWVDIVTHALSLKAIAMQVCRKCDKSMPAKAFCVTCAFQSPLCDHCCIEHTNQYLDHYLCYDVENIETDDEEECSISKGYICAPCSIDGDKIDATAFCLTCKEPELMCNVCAGQHIKERISRNHDLCYDLSKLLGPSQSNHLLCENCKVKGQSCDALAFCLTCEHPEPLCVNCQKTHKKENQCHEISLNIQQLTKCTLCEPCLFSKTKIESTHFCLDCKEPEPMCKTCSDQHLKLRSGRGHRLCDDISKFPGHARVQFHILPSIIPSTNVNQISPGKPKAMNTKSDSITVFWRKSTANVKYYQIQYKRNGEDENWKFIQTEKDENTIHITELMADTRYIVQVQAINEKQQGRFGPANDKITTSKSLGSNLLKYSIKGPEGIPQKYKLVADEQRTARNEAAKTKKLIFGNPRRVLEEEKTIMLVGATGSGKSTLVDGFVNYLMGVNFDDPFRFTLITLEKEEEKTHDQAVSQTEWITVYRIAPQNESRLNYTLNIIDTPGFGDTRGIQQDQRVIDQIRQLFMSEGDQGVLAIDAVCFIVKAPDARLTASQKYIFSSIMSLFGKDIEPIICTFVTFSDGAEPPVLASLNKANLPFGSTFQFNNSALFVKNRDMLQTQFPRMFWDMGCASFKTFFDKLPYFGRRSLILTNAVLRDRERLKTIIFGLQADINNGLSKLARLREEATLFRDHEAEIKRNEQFEYEVEEEVMYLEDVPVGRYVTNCLICNRTCHDNCIFADDNDKIRCCAMSNGYCTICPRNCLWSNHRNAPQLYKTRVTKVKKTYQETKEKYTKAKDEKMTVENVISALLLDVENLEEKVKNKLEEMKRCKKRLSEIALQPDPLSTEDNINMLIMAEEREKQPGYEKRIKLYYEFRDMARIEERTNEFCDEYHKTKNDVPSIVRSSKSEIAPKIFVHVSRFVQNFWNNFISK
nr:uncharacterized protein LOC111113294 isoform X4 [Crassostrea virginica]XP_022307145.1 uncharacterized protein LOC111113294 isoform X4 [Crassostrea virginica]XP_022307146.1 uncharacterized protein LOC111113294 isoform X4 [Crassostrea virginica]XP_022307147.1 uncharacterized protein LOC111113294 isoform X4 [Crassostrea virginica]XP_022307148.1 uncharacterized protein LOC111113294 isoform X4 [Crassostrea virginica]XP_022307149.1 uncharacterized protein LOC111113294 isoform X4 [Crassostrea virg